MEDERVGDRKWLGDEKVGDRRVSFYECFVVGWKSEDGIFFLIVWEEIWEKSKCKLYEITLVPLLH